MGPTGFGGGAVLAGDGCAESRPPVAGVPVPTPRPVEGGGRALGEGGCAAVCKFTENVCLYPLMETEHTAILPLRHS